MLILNFKTYEESTGRNSMKLLESIERAIEQNPKIKNLIAVAPSLIDIAIAKKNYPSINLISQHTDHKSSGSTTGWVTPENLLAMGIKDSILNHSEHRIMDTMSLEEIKTIQEKGINLILCCESVEEAKKLLELKPMGIAYEPKDLIGSGVSVTTRPEAVKEFIDTVKGKTMAFIGAGVSTGEDVAKSLELGADGILLASAFVKAENPVAKLNELVQPFLK